MTDKKTGSGIFREKSMERVSSPEELNDYIRVTTPSVWIVLIALVVLLVGMLAWSIFERWNGTMRTAARRSCTPLLTSSIERMRRKNCHAANSFVSKDEHTKLCENFRTEERKMENKEERKEIEQEAAEVADSELDRVSGGFLRKVESRIPSKTPEQTQDETKA